MPSAVFGRTGWLPGFSWCSAQGRGMPAAATLAAHRSPKQSISVTSTHTGVQCITIGEWHANRPTGISVMKCGAISKRQALTA